MTNICLPGNGLDINCVELAVRLQLKRVKRRKWKEMRVKIFKLKISMI